MALCETVIVISYHLVILMFTEFKLTQILHYILSFRKAVLFQIKNCIGMLQAAHSLHLSIWKQCKIQLYQHQTL
jgi:hypothetical protein